MSAYSSYAIPYLPSLSCFVLIPSVGEIAPNSMHIWTAEIRWTSASECVEWLPHRNSYTSKLKVACPLFGSRLGVESFRTQEQLTSCLSRDITRAILPLLVWHIRISSKRTPHRGIVARRDCTRNLRVRHPALRRCQDSGSYHHKIIRRQVRGGPQCSRSRRWLPVADFCLIRVGSSSVFSLEQTNSLLLTVIRVIKEF